MELGEHWHLRVLRGRNKKKQIETNRAQALEPIAVFSCWPLPNKKKKSRERGALPAFDRSAAAWHEVPTEQLKDLRGKAESADGLAQERVRQLSSWKKIVIPLLCEIALGAAESSLAWAHLVL